MRDRIKQSQKLSTSSLASTNNKTIATKGCNRMKKKMGGGDNAVGGDVEI